MESWIEDVLWTGLTYESHGISVSETRDDLSGKTVYRIRDVRQGVDFTVSEDHAKILVSLLTKLLEK